MFETRLAYPVFDADNHFYDAPDAISRHLERRFLDSGQVAFDYQPDTSQRHRAQMLEEYGIAVGLPGSHTYKANPLRIEDAEEREKVVQSFRLMAPAFQSRDNRLEVMDVQGLEAVIMFPTGVGVSVANQLLDDADANAANVRAYNRFVQDDWGFAYGDRIFAVANVPLANIDVMVAELDRVLDEDARAILLPPGPLNGRSPADPYYDPFWARIQEAGARVVVHLGYTRYQRAGAEFGYDPDAHYFDGFDAFQWFAYWGDRPVMETIAAMIFHNLFTRFPDLRVGIIEHGAVWAPYTVRKMDHGHMMGREARYGELSDRPSDLFRRHFLVAPYPEENIRRILDVLTPDSLVFGSDFPHPEGLPDPVTYVHELRELPEADQRKIMSENLAGFLGLAS